MVDGVFFNPNIYPAEEEEKRWATYEKWAKEVGLNARRIQLPYQEWFKSAASDLRRPKRCQSCYHIRLAHTARLAKKGGYDGFSTTLLVSPYQDHGAILDTMKKVSKEHEIPYVYNDLRRGYLRSRQMARGNHMYMQKYCGCEFSLGGDG